MSWEAYINGHIISTTSRTYIQNLLAATAATQTEDSDNSSDDTDAEQWENLGCKAGNMDLVRQTLACMSTKLAEEGVKAMGRHARTIRLGRSLWGSSPLAADVTCLIQERFFDDGSFPAMKEVKTAVTMAKNLAEERPAPFQGETLPSATLTTTAYGQRLGSWLDTVQRCAETGV